MKQRAAKKIQDFLDSRVAELVPSRQLQYASRFYRVTGDAKYAQIIRECLVDIIEELEEKISLVKEDIFAKRAGKKLLEEMKKKEWYSKMNRLDIYESRPEYKLIQRIIFLSHKIIEFYPSSKERIVSALSSIDEDTLMEGLLDNEVITNDPSQNLNTVYWSRNLKIVDVFDQYVNKGLSIFPLSSISPASSLRFHNQIYFYTHLIIVASDYYQRFPEVSEVINGIFNFFDAHAAEIELANRNDMLAEIGVCYWLMKMDEEEFPSRIKDTLLYSFNGSFIETEGQEEVNKLQHTNMLAAILFESPQKLFPGPDLGQLEVGF